MLRSICAYVMMAAVVAVEMENIKLFSVILEAVVVFARF